MTTMTTRNSNRARIVIVIAWVVSLTILSFAIRLKEIGVL